MAEVDSRKKGRHIRLSRKILLFLIGGSFFSAALVPHLLVASCFAGLGLASVFVFERKMRMAVERIVRKRVQAPDVSPELLQLQAKMQKKQEEMHDAYIGFEDMRREYHRLEEEYRLFKEEINGQLEQKETVLGEYQRTIQEQRGILEQKQIYIAQLENKVRDLMYEIRSLLQLEEPVTTALPPIDMLNREEVHDYYMGNRLQAFDLDLALSRLVDRAEQFTGVEHLGSRFLQGGSSFAIDLRRLFDSMRDEQSGIIFFYSTAQKKILFANNYVKTLLGYSPEKFINDFPQLLIAGKSVWREALMKIQTARRLSLVFVTRKGEEKKLDCEMKVIRKGPFAGNIMGMIIE